MSFKETYQRKKAERDQFVAALNPKSFDFQIATWFGSGLIIPAPGTWGTLGGLLFGIPLLILTNQLVVFITAIALFFIGLKSVERIEKKIDGHDPSFIVIDEVVAILLCLALIGTSNLYLTTPLIFLLFRFYDAKKPLLIGLADRKIKGALGVMIDDIVAAVFALITLWLILIIRVFTVWPILEGF